MAVIVADVAPEIWTPFSVQLYAKLLGAW